MNVSRVNDIYSSSRLQRPLSLRQQRILILLWRPAASISAVCLSRCWQSGGQKEMGATLTSQMTFCVSIQVSVRSFTASQTPGKRPRLSQSGAWMRLDGVSEAAVCWDVVWALVLHLISAPSSVWWGFISPPQRPLVSGHQWPSGEK